jgi:hypothetical protein
VNVAFKNGEAAPDYQFLVNELGALDDALKQLQDLKPGKHELLQLTSIRLVALQCQVPLQKFSDKISKFERRLSVANTRNQRFTGLPRRMQWRLAYREDVKELRLKLGSHVMTINLLLMTQTISCITSSEHDRAEAASGLHEKILAIRGLLEDVQAGVDSSSALQQETKPQVERQARSLSALDHKADHIIQQLRDDNGLIQEVKSAVSKTEKRTRSILAMATDTLSQATLGLLTLRDIAMKLSDLIASIGNLTAEIRKSITLLMRQFAHIHRMLRNIEGRLPERIYLPIVEFTDALGESFALPYQVCLRWETFQLMLNAMFDGRPGRARVQSGDFLMINATSGRRLLNDSWDHTIREGDRLQMSMVMNDFLTSQDLCPFPSCRALVIAAEVKSTGITCNKCARWINITGFDYSEISKELMRAHTELRGPKKSEKLREIEERLSQYEDEKGGFIFPEEKAPEDIELYRHISVIAAEQAERGRIQTILRQSKKFSRADKVVADL